MDSKPLIKPNVEESIQDRQKDHSTKKQLSAFKSMVYEKE